MTQCLRAISRIRLLRAGGALALCLLLAACASGGARQGAGDNDGAPVAMPSLEALMGDWFVAARAPWFGERGHVAARVRFAVEDTGRITIARSWRDGFAEPLETEASVARRVGGGDRIWKIRAWGVLPTQLRVLEAAEDGSWLLLDAPDRNLAWILTRAQLVGDDAYLELEHRIRRHGVNTDRLRRIAQVPGQEGLLGFEPAASPTPGR